MYNIVDSHDLQSFDDTKKILSLHGPLQKDISDEDLVNWDGSVAASSSRKEGT